MEIILEKYGFKELGLINFLPCGEKKSKADKKTR